MLEIQQRTDGRVLKLGPGTLYGAIKRLLTRGRLRKLVAYLADSDLDDERRRYYRLTDFGLRRRITCKGASRLEDLVKQAR